MADNSELDDTLKQLRELSKQAADLENSLYQELDFIQRRMIIKFGFEIDISEYDPEEWKPKEQKPAETTTAKPHVASKYGVDIKIPGCKPERPAETTAKPQVARKYGLDIEIPERSKAEERKLQERKLQEGKPEERKLQERKPEERNPEERKPGETTAKPKFLKRKTVDGRLTIAISKDGEISITTTERKRQEASKQEMAPSGASPKVSAEPDFGLTNVLAEPDFGLTKVPAEPDFGLTKVPAEPDFGLTKAPAEPDFGLTKVPAEPDFGLTKVPAEPDFGLTKVPAEPDFGLTEMVSLIMAKPEDITLAANEWQKAKEEEQKKANAEKFKKGNEETSKKKAKTEKPKMSDKQGKDKEKKEKDPLDLFEKSFVDAQETLQIVKELTDAEVKVLKSGYKTNRKEEEVLRNMNVENVTSELLDNLREQAIRDQNAPPYGTEAYYKCEMPDKKQLKKQKQKEKKEQQQQEAKAAARSAEARGELYEVEEHRWDDMLTSEEFNADAYRRKKAVMELYEKKTCMLHELRLARSLNFNLQNTLDMTKMRIADVEEQLVAAQARIHHKPGCICHYH